MLEFYVAGQTLKLYTPVIAADTLHYLTGVVHFTGDEWDGYAKWIHFTQGEGLGATVYDVALTDDAFDETAELTLTVGEWNVYMTGTLDTARLTTVPLILTVKASGLIDAPLHPMPQSVAEQIDSKASTALAYAAAVKAARDHGELDGADGRSFTIRGFYDTYADMIAHAAAPQAGDAYGVGTAVPYDIYLWDEIHGIWKNNGPIQSGKGLQGDPGPVFTPNVDASGNISWTNNGGLDNPTTRNILGPTGATGPAGADGADPYDYAVEHGFTGTEETFYTGLVAAPYHNARHAPTGADPITVETGNLASGAVTTAKVGDGQVTLAKLASDAKIHRGTINIGSSWSGSGPWTQTVTVSGATITSNTKVDLQVDATLAASMVNNACTALFITNSSGTLTLTAVTGKPAAQNNVQVVYYETV